MIRKQDRQLTTRVAPWHRGCTNDTPRGSHPSKRDIKRPDLRILVSGSPGDDDLALFTAVTVDARHVVVTSPLRRKVPLTDGDAPKKKGLAKAAAIPTRLVTGTDSSSLGRRDHLHDDASVNHCHDGVDKVQCQLRRRRRSSPPRRRRSRDGESTSFFFSDGCAFFAHDATTRLRSWVHAKSRRARERKEYAKLCRRTRKGQPRLAIALARLASAPAAAVFKLATGRWRGGLEGEADQKETVEREKS